MDLAAVIIRWGIRLYLVSRYYFEKITNTGGFGKDHAVHIEQRSDTPGDRLKDRLQHYHIKQFHESSCSVASVVSVVNTLLARQGNTPSRPVTQHELLDRVRAEHWKERMSEKGYRGKRGLPLEVLGAVVQESLDVYRVAYRSVEVVPANQTGRDANRFKRTLARRLEQFDSSGTGLLIAHFNQGRFLPELHIPHISPVGGFDTETGQVTVLDVDPGQQQPYRVSFETFCKGLSCNYNNIFRPFGYVCGGYVWIRL